MRLARLVTIRVTASVFSLLAIPLATFAAAQDITDLFQGETVVFPVDTLDQQARRELSTCFRVE